MNDETIVPIRRRMTEQEFDAELRRIHQTYGNKRTEAANRFEQELALACYHSGWTQEEIAEKVGKSRQWADQRLRFGRFLENATSGSNLSERAFRGFWEKTDSNTGNERMRFREIERLITQDKQDRAERKDLGPINKAIRENFMDGRWHAVPMIAAKLEQPVEEVERSLASMLRQGKDAKFQVTSRRRGRGYEYRLFSRDKTISSHEVRERLAPLIQRLRVQARTDMATISHGELSAISSELQHLVDEWSQ